MADIKSRLIEIEGVGEVKAQAIIDAGFDTLDKINKASIGDLSDITGITSNLAGAIKEIFYEGVVTDVEEAEIVEEEEEEEVEAEIVEEEVEAEIVEEEVEAEIVEEEEEVYLVKAKPELPEEILTKLRKKKKTPKFRRQEWFRYSRLDTGYRRAKGLHSKARRHLKYRPPSPRIGYRTQAEIRGLHPSGFREVMVYRPNDIESIDPKKEAARIGSTVGARKREDIIEIADKRGIRILNRW